MSYKWCPNCGGTQFNKSASSELCKSCNTQMVWVTTEELAAQEKLNQTNANSRQGCGCLIVILVVLYFIGTSCGSSGGSGGGSDLSCHDRVSVQYVNGSLSDLEYISKLNSECGENN